MIAAEQKKQEKLSKAMDYAVNRKEYETKRQALINEAEALINEGKLEEANKKMEAVTELDKNFEAAAKAEAEEKARKTQETVKATPQKQVQQG